MLSTAADSWRWRHGWVAILSDSSFGIESPCLTDTREVHEPTALATATIAPVRLVGADRRTESIEVGKAADLVLVEPIRQSIGDLRNTRLVMMDEK